MWTYYIKLALLSIKKTPVLSSLMVMATAIGIAACLTTFTMYSVIAGNPLAEKNDQIFAIQLDSWSPDNAYRSPNEMPYQLTYKDAVAMWESDNYDKAAIMMKSGLTVQKSDMTGMPAAKSTRLTTSDFFSMFNAKFIYGAPWNKEADINAAKVTVIDETINNLIFDGANSVGEPILLEGEIFTVTGVVSDNWILAPKVHDLNSGAFDEAEHVYIPFSHLANTQYPRWGNDNGWVLRVIRSYQQRLESEKVWIQGWVELNTAQKKQEFSQFIEGYITQQKQNGRFQRPLKYKLNTPQEWLELVRVVSNDDRVLVGLSTAFLLVCLVNTIVMLLAKFLRKAPEAGVRRALGASKSAIFWQHIFESLTIGIAGGLLGLLFSWAGLAGIREIYGQYNNVAVMNTFTVVAALSLAFLSSFFSGALPAWRISHTQPASYLKTQ